MEPLPYDDLKAFEHRLQEVVTQHRPSRARHSVLLAVLVFAVALVLYLVPMLPWMQFAITLAVIILMLPLLLDYQKPELTREEIVAQTRSVLEAFDMSCDDSGKLILKASRNRTPNTAKEGS